MGSIEKVVKMTRLSKILLAIIVAIHSSLSAPTDLGSQTPKAIVADVFTKEWLPITEGERTPIKIGERRCGVAFDGITLPCTSRPNLPESVYKKNRDFNTNY